MWFKKWKGKNKSKECNCDCGCNRKMGGCGCGYGLGVIGAAVYFIATSAQSGFWWVILGLLKALVWPVFAVYGLLRFLGM